MSDEEKEKSEVWEYLRRRTRLDEEIQTKFARPVTLMFTDIKGSTTFFDMRGDIAGVSMLQRHNDLVLPSIEAEGGRVIKGLGDGLMVLFAGAASGVRAAIQIQRTLAEFNRNLPERERIRLRIGLNSGVGLVEDRDVFGDVVNAAARVQGLAEPDQIVVSESAYNEARVELGAEHFVPLGPAVLKGKLEQVRIYEVVWSPDKSRVRGATRASPGSTRALRLELDRVGDRLKVSSYELVGREVETLRAYDECDYDEVGIGAIVQQIGSLLDSGDREGRVSSQDLDRLAELGQSLYEQLLPVPTRDKVSQSDAVELVMAVDDQLVQIPWELLHDGREFLCLRFAMGRTVSTRQPVAEGPPAADHGRLRMLVVADPRGDLPEARKEGVRLGGELGPGSAFDVVTKRGITRAEFEAQFGAFDIVHFAGHADYDAEAPGSDGLLLSDGRMQANELQSLSGRGAVPRLVFFNACQTGRTDQWAGPEPETAVFGLANSILLTGVKHYLGTVRRLQDDAGLQYAVEFYRQLAGGQSIGLAVRDARRALAERQGKSSLTWASYVLYGDPTSRYLTTGGTAPAKEAPGPTRRARWPRFVALGAVAAAVLAAALYGVNMSHQRRLDRAEAVAVEKAESGRLGEARSDFESLQRSRPAAAYEGLATIAFRESELAKASDLCRQALQANPRRPECFLVQGDIQMIEGAPDRARASFEAALALPALSPSQRATAYNRLGRLDAGHGQVDRAEAGYKKAREADPGDWQSLSNLGALLRQQGRYAEAIAALDSAAAMRPGDPLIESLLKDSREAQTLSRDQAKRRRVDELAQDLSRRYRSGDLRAVSPPADDWTSTPLTLSLLPLDGREQLAFREGEHEFMLMRLGQMLEAQTRVRLVERAVLDKLLEELQLSSTALVDPKTALRIGRLLAARLILVGSIRRGGAEWQVTVRVIETETSAIAASAAESFPFSQSIRDAPERLVKQLRPKLVQAYPLRGRVAGSGDGRVTLNVGASEGAAPGQRLQIFRDGQGGQPELLARVELVEVQDKRSQAKVLDQQLPPTQGLKAVQIP